MFGYITPQEAGVPSEAIDRFLSILQRNGINMHSLMMMKGNNVFYQHEWAPFTIRSHHRMYSVTKSFVAIAIGCLLDEGKIDLDDPVVRYFSDKLPDEVSPYLARQTIRHMLMMSTCICGCGWFLPSVTDRTRFYFSHKPGKPAGSLFDYDSTGSYILGVLVERVSGMPLLQYLREKVLNHIGGFEDAEILATPDGTPWGDSALLCTNEDLTRFARFVMNYGSWDGKQLLSEAYLRDATRVQTFNNLNGVQAYNTYGYGYQIWMTEQNGFSFHGMGGQFAICVPDKDFIFTCTGDNQYNDDLSGSVIFRAVFDEIVSALPGGSDPEEPAPYNAIGIAEGEATSAFANVINSIEYECESNSMGITQFRFEFREKDGSLIYRNAQGEKEISFGMGHNVFGLFPQLGYSDDRGNVHEITDFKYKCAASAGWLEPQKIQIRVQIIDRYFGSVFMTFGFVDTDTVGVRMIKTAEDFLNEYNGWMIARRKG